MLRRVSEIRELRDPRALRALAHPGRIRLLEELMMLGSATATQLSERVGESPANCSWHLRQLERYGYVEEAGGGTGRRRPWRLVPEVRTWGHDDTDAELNVVGDAVADMILDREVAALRDWERRRRNEDPRWRSAAGVTHSLTWLTVEELADINEQITELLSRHVERLDPAQRPAGTRAVRLTAWGVPARPEEGRHDA
jgi:DNA-binding transcriptional ArsR family regulator